MKKKLVPLVACLLTSLALAPCLAEPVKDPLAELQTGFARPVAVLIERIVECQYRGGEVPDDAARRAENNKPEEETL